MYHYYVRFSIVGHQGGRLFLDVTNRIQSKEDILVIEQMIAEQVTKQFQIVDPDVLIDFYALLSNDAE